MWYIADERDGTPELPALDEDEDADHAAVFHEKESEAQTSHVELIRPILPAKPDQRPWHVTRYFGTVPPRKTLSVEKITPYVENLAATLKGLELDAFLVYDIQEEESRVEGQKRPFAYSATYEPRVFAKLLSDATGLSSVVYRTVACHPRESFKEWLDETWDVFNVHSLVLVGGSSSAIAYLGYSVPEAAKIIRESGKPFTLGGIVLPERHRDKGIEHELLARKTETGISMFTSQVVYNADLAIWLLRDYDELCKAKKLEPARIVFTFAPFGRKDTADFLKWLGVEIPVGTEKRVLSRQTNQARVAESVDICRENFRRILNAVEYYGMRIPLGFTVESVSKYQDEFKGSLNLYALLKLEALAFEKRQAEAARRA